MADTILRKINSEYKTSYSEFKEAQRATIAYAGQGDVLCVLPTGYGKTLVIMALPYLDESSDSTVVVVNGLKSIIEEQRHKFGDRCIYIDELFVKELESVTDKKQADINRLLSGDTSLKFILAHPEQLVHPAVKEALMKTTLNISHLVVDEAHCVLSWGKSNFRPSYMQLGSLRSVLDKAKVLALTATATKKAQKQIISALCMVNPKTVAESPDRPNIYLEVCKRAPSTGGSHTATESMYEVIDPFLTELKNQTNNFNKTIVYVPLKWCGLLHYRASSQFLDVVHSFNSESKLQTLVAQYHAPQSQEMKSLIVRDMTDPFGNLRLLFATEAYGMGIDVPDIRQVVHVGPPSNIETYIQEIGRCGRDGEAGKATLFFNKSDIGQNVAHLDDAMRKFILTKECRRKFIAEYFGFVHDDMKVEKHLCCDNCNNIEEVEEMVPTSTEELLSTEQQKQQATVMLSTYFRAENGIVVNALLPQLATGLTESLIDTLSSSLKYSDSDIVSHEFPHLKSVYCDNIARILSVAFGSQKNQSASD